jgi:hypothetical protein
MTLSPAAAHLRWADQDYRAVGVEARPVGHVAEPVEEVVFQPPLVFGAVVDRHETVLQADKITRELRACTDLISWTFTKNTIAIPAVIRVVYAPVPGGTCSSLYHARL